MLNPNIILGCTARDTVMLDFDGTKLAGVKYWAGRACRWFRLGGFIVLESSLNHYHVVFNRSVSWDENMHVVAWVCLESHNVGLQRWQLMQCIKHGSTLRVSRKGSKPSPRVVSRYGKQDSQIKGFLEYRKLVKRISAKIPV